MRSRRLDRDPGRFSTFMTPEQVEDRPADLQFAMHLLAATVSRNAGEALLFLASIRELHHRGHPSVDGGIRPASSDISPDQVRQPHH